MEYKIIHLCRGVSPRASMNVTPKVKRSPEEAKLLKAYTEKAIKRT